MVLEYLNERKLCAQLVWVKTQLVYFCSFCYVSFIWNVSSWFIHFLNIYCFKTFLNFVCGSFCRIDYWPGLRRSWVSSENDGFRPQCAEIHWEIPSWGLSSCFLPIGCGLLWPHPWQPVSDVDSLNPDLINVIIHHLWRINQCSKASTSVRMHPYKCSCTINNGNWNDPIMRGKAPLTPFLFLFYFSGLLFRSWRTVLRP